MNRFITRVLDTKHLLNSSRWKSKYFYLNLYYLILKKAQQRCKDMIKNFNQWFVPILKPTHRYPELVKLVRNFDSWKNAPDLLYLGDSVVERISSNDTDKRTVDQIVANNLIGRKRLLCISHSAYHMKIYYHLLQILKFTKHKPEIVLLPVNLRSFSPQWDLRPAWQFEDEINALRQYANNPTREIPRLRELLDTPAENESFRSIEVNYPLTDFIQIGQFSDVISSNIDTEEQKRFRKRQIYIYHYLHPLKLTHPKVEFLCKIIDLLQDMRIGLLVYITPINFQGGERYLENDFTKILKKNIKVLYSSISPHIEKSNTRFLDLSMAMSSDYFFSPDETTEHLNQHGRANLALKLANEVLLMDAKIQGEPNL